MSSPEYDVTRGNPSAWAVVLRHADKTPATMVKSRNARNAGWGGISTPRWCRQDPRLATAIFVTTGYPVNCGVENRRGQGDSHGRYENHQTSRVGSSLEPAPGSGLCSCRG